MSGGQEDSVFYDIEAIIGWNPPERLYLVKWAGYPDNQSTWEPEVNLTKTAIDDFCREAAISDWPSRLPEITSMLLLPGAQSVLNAVASLDSSAPPAPQDDVLWQLASPAEIDDDVLLDDLPVSPPQDETALPFTAQAASPQSKTQPQAAEPKIDFQKQTQVQPQSPTQATSSTPSSSHQPHSAASSSVPGSGASAEPAPAGVSEDDDGVPADLDEIERWCPQRQMYCVRWSVPEGQREERTWEPAKHLVEFSNEPLDRFCASRGYDAWPHLGGKIVETTPTKKRARPTQSSPSTKESPPKVQKVEARRTPPTTPQAARQATPQPSPQNTPTKRAPATPKTTPKTTPKPAAKPAKKATEGRKTPTKKSAPKKRTAKKAVKQVEEEAEEVEVLYFVEKLIKWNPETEMYLVRWDGDWDAEQETWEAADNLVECDTVMREFLQREGLTEPPHVTAERAKQGGQSAQPAQPAGAVAPEPVGAGEASDAAAEVAAPAVVEAPASAPVPVAEAVVEVTP